MKKPYRKIPFLIIWILAVALSGCVKNSASSPIKTVSPGIIIPTYTETFSPDISIEENSTPIPITKETTPSTQKKDHFFESLRRDLLLGIVRDDRDFCNILGNEEIWISKYPYHDTLTLLADDHSDYQMAKWSPDGGWIAYVESKPEIVFSDNVDMSAVKGTAKVWLVRPDGSEKHPVSDAIPAVIYSRIVGNVYTCSDLSFISYLSWSPDGKFLVFVRTWVNKGIRGTAEFYITEIATGNTNMFLSQGGGYKDIFWRFDENNFFLQSDNDQLLEVNVQNIENIQIKSTPLIFPEKVRSFKYIKFLPSGNELKPYAIFYMQADNSTSPNTSDAERVIILRLDLLSRNWSEIVELPLQFFSEKGVLNDAIILCDNDHGYKVFDSKNGELLGVVEIPSDLDYRACSFTEVDSGDNNLWVIFKGTKNKEEGLWASALIPGSDEDPPELVFNTSKFLDSPSEISFFSYQPK